MDILEQCQKWHENEEYQKIIDALEAMPPEERTPEADSELARAYNNVAVPGKEGRPLYKKALALLKPHAELFAGDHRWNYRMAYAYFYLDQEGRALRYFEKALEARPGDEDTIEAIEMCRKGISLPEFCECFRERVESVWGSFAWQEKELRQLLAEERGAEAVARIEEILGEAFDGIAFEVGFNGEKCDLILIPEGNKARLFELDYFRNHAPAEVLERWSILAGRQPVKAIALRIEDGLEISAEDVLVWLKEDGDGGFGLYAYCEKLLPMLHENEGRAWWAINTLTDLAIGEVPNMRHINSLDVLQEPKNEPSIDMSELAGALEERGLDLSCDPQAYLESFAAYEGEPNTNKKADWRLDIIKGATSCAPPFNGYLAADNNLMDSLHADGITAGFFCYPLDELREEGGEERLLDFQKELKQALYASGGEEIIAFTGGATGLYYGYVDLIAWDIQAVLDKAKEFFEDSIVPSAYFHTFYREAGTVALKKPEGEEDDGTVIYYDEDEMNAVQEHIERFFGKPSGVFHEIESIDIHVDIIVVPPSEGRGYYTAVTMGAGARRMNVPEELAGRKLDRAEFAIALPADWKMDQEDWKDERWYWPIRLLKTLAHLPIDEDGWLGWGHTVDYEEGFAENTKLCGVILAAPQDVGEGGDVCVLPGGDDVNFYQVIPLYREEIDFKLSSDAEALLGNMPPSFAVVDPARPNALTKGDGGYAVDMDDGDWHLENIAKKELPLPEIAAYNHMAIYLRWCIERGLMGDAFLAEYGEAARKVMADPASSCLRELIRDELEGILSTGFFNKEGAAFASYYYCNRGWEPCRPSFPSDIHNHALEYFGPARYNSDEFKDEACLFVPFDEDYYQAMAKVIDGRFAAWREQGYNEATMQPSALARALIKYLDCECDYFPAMRDDDPITAAYSYARREALREGFVPILVRADDEILWECLMLNSCPGSEGNGDCSFDAGKVAEFRNNALKDGLKDGKAVLEELASIRKWEAEDDGMDWDAEVVGKMEGGEANGRFASYWNSDIGMTHPLILAKIPAKNPWEVFAWLPFGGWNECPDTHELMAAAKYWFERHGAVPAAMTHDELEFALSKPVRGEDALDAAIELYGFSPDALVQWATQYSTVGTLADALRKSTVWYVWWD